MTDKKDDVQINDHGVYHNGAFVKGYAKKMTDNMTNKEVEALLRRNGLSWAGFNAWIAGQTCPMLDDGTLAYFTHDVERYIAWKTKGITPIWD